MDNREKIIILQTASKLIDMLYRCDDAALVDRVVYAVVNGDAIEENDYEEFEI